MKKYYIIVLCLMVTLLLTSCGSNNQEQTLQSETQIQQTKEVQLDQTNEIKPLSNKNLVEQNYKKAQLMKKVSERKDNIHKISTELNVSDQKIEEIFQKYENQFQEYVDLSVKDELTNQENIRKIKIKKFLHKNISIQNGVDVEYEKFEEVLESGEIVKVFEHKDEILSQTLPSGIIVDKETKASFIDFYTNNSDEFHGDLVVAESSFIELVNNDAYIHVGKCNKISNEIDRSFCEEMNK